MNSLFWLLGASTAVIPLDIKASRMLLAPQDLCLPFKRD